MTSRLLLPLLALTALACTASPSGPAAPLVVAGPAVRAGSDGPAGRAAVRGAAPDPDEQPALTIYNADFGVVRELLAIDLVAGVNDVSVADMTMLLEPDSVMLRDADGRRALRILEQNYRNDPVTQELLLSLFEGETIEFLTVREGIELRVPGRIVRSGYVPPGQAGGYDRFGNYRPPPQVGSSQPIIEVDGALRFSLPGLPLFPSLSDDTVLQPTLRWLIETDAAGACRAELAYVTGGLNWEADYNLVSPEDADTLDLVGWITMQNQTGKTFRDAHIKLMAGDVNKIEEGAAGGRMTADYAAREMAMGAPVVTEKAFDEFHLYTLARRTTLRDRETKQVEFVRAAGIPSRRLYVYDGAAIDRNRWNGWDATSLRSNPDYGTQSNPKVWVMREFENDEASGLGIPLPKGKLRFYTRDSDGQLEFTGENLIDHTPKDETVRVYTGNAFDLVGERVRTDFRVDNDQDWIDESFRITLRNHKDEAVEFRVVEHLYRWVNWELRDVSFEYEQTDSRTVEARVTVPADGEAVLTYTAHYTW
jgi:hypothetical protein